MPNIYIYIHEQRERSWFLGLLCLANTLEPETLFKHGLLMFYGNLVIKTKQQNVESAEHVHFCPGPEAYSALRGQVREAQGKLQHFPTIPL